MPLLPKEIDAFPDDVFDRPLATAPWQIAHVRSRQEKLLGRYFRDRGVPFYLPQAEQKKRRAGRTFVSHLVLFPGYVFFRGSAPEVDLARRSNVVVGIIAVQDQELLARELAQIRALQLAGASFRPCETFVPGDTVTIAGGAFRGYTGVVVREKGVDRLVVRITMLRQAVAVEFDREVLARGTPLRRR